MWIGKGGLGMAGEDEEGVERMGEKKGGGGGEGWG